MLQAGNHTLRERESEIGITRKQADPTFAVLELSPLKGSNSEKATGQNPNLFGGLRSIVTKDRDRCFTYSSNWECSLSTCASRLEM